MQIKFSHSLKVKSLMFLLVMGILSDISILICAILFSPILLSAFTGIGGSNNPEEYGARMVFIICALLVALLFIISLLLTFGVWRAFRRVLKSTAINWLHKISIFLLISVLVIEILFIWNVYFI